MKTKCRALLLTMGALVGCLVSANLVSAASLNTEAAEENREAESADERGETVDATTVKVEEASDYVRAYLPRIISQ